MTKPYAELYADAVEFNGHFRDALARLDELTLWFEDCAPMPFDRLESVFKQLCDMNLQFTHTLVQLVGDPYTHSDPVRRAFVKSLWALCICTPSVTIAVMRLLDDHTKLHYLPEVHKWTVELLQATS